MGEGGGIILSQHSCLITENKILICCGDSVFCLSLPSLKLLWNQKLDDITCFQIFKCEDDFLIHGEIDITRIDTEGKIKWKFSGKDIFVSLTNENEISIVPDGVLLIDFGQTKYKIDFDGKLVWTNNSNK
ncbi:hypothetical protein [Flectobacillus longus]|uniref:hypothetical protein n=1 Tax=Flectobacillus longus TaxID=2984207 RepID=UPI0024B863F9|nr:hypothetical protein [Flectobacillus longus]MDI9879715.1 hypothetical protein [Flectobacillus longus]